MPGLTMTRLKTTAACWMPGGPNPNQAEIFPPREEAAHPVVLWCKVIDFKRAIPTVLVSGQYDVQRRNPAQPSATSRPFEPWLLDQMRGQDIRERDSPRRTTQTGRSNMARSRRWKNTFFFLLSPTKHAAPPPPNIKFIIEERGRQIGPAAQKLAKSFSAHKKTS